MFCLMYYYLSVCLFIFSHGVVGLFRIYEFECPSGIFCFSHLIIEFHEGKHGYKMYKGLKKRVRRKYFDKDQIRKDLNLIITHTTYF